MRWSSGSHRSFDQIHGNWSLMAKKTKQKTSKTWAVISSLASGGRWYVWPVRKVGFGQMRRFIGIQGSMLRVLMDSWDIGEGSAELAILAVSKNLRWARIHCRELGTRSSWRAVSLAGTRSCMTGKSSSKVYRRKGEKKMG